MDTVALAAQLPNPPDLVTLGALLGAEDAVKIIDAIGDLWPVVLPLAFVAVVFFLRNRFENFSLRHGETQASISAKKSDENATIAAQVEVQSLDKPSPVVAVTPSPSTEEQIEPTAAEAQSNPDTEFHEALEKRDFERAKTIKRKLVSEIEGVGQRKEKEVTLLYFIAQRGDDASFEELRSLADDGEVGGLAAGLLGLYYKNGGNYGRARDYLKVGIKSANPKWATSSVLVFAEIQRLAEDFEGAISELKNHLLRTDIEKTLRAKVYLALAEVYESSGNDVLRLVALHSAAILTPTKTGTRFNASFHASSIPNLHLAEYVIWGYEIVESLEPESHATLNNLGASYAELSLPVHSVDYYRAAAKAGSTISMGNLALDLIEHGHLDEAEKILREAGNAVDVHENVSRAIIKLGEARSEEEKKVEKIRRRGQEYAEFFSEFSECYYGSGQLDLVGKWNSGAGDVIVKVGAEPGTLEVQTVETSGSQKWRAELRVSGSAAVGVLEREDYRYSSIQFWTNDGSLMVYASGTSVHAMYLHRKTDSEITEWIRVAIKDGAESS